jgi:2-oxo-4-hydroxy-4-carboxy-5-ureidoimidazoline decarboxylase
MKLRPSQMTRTRFLSLFADIFEHSPWIASQVWDQGLEPRHDSPGALHQLFTRVVRTSPEDQQLSLLLAHPQLAVGIASSEELSAASQVEQKGAGLDQCEPREYAEFQNLNQVYLAKFGFPFIMAVKGSHRNQILEVLKSRSMGDKEKEFEAAMEQVLQIALFRIEEKFESQR